MTLRIMGENLLASGGAYFRLLPYPILRAAVKSSDRRVAPGSFYTHPWELDPELPLLPIPRRARLRTRPRRLLKTGSTPCTRVLRVDATVRLMHQASRSKDAA